MDLVFFNIRFIPNVSKFRHRPTPYGKRTYGNTWKGEGALGGNEPTAFSSTPRLGVGRVYPADSVDPSLRSPSARPYCTIQYNSKRSNRTGSGAIERYGRKEITDDVRKLEEIILIVASRRGIRFGVWAARQVVVIIYCSGGSGRRELTSP